jgi:hypothetical protein
MSEKFIYVFDASSRDRLLENNYQLIKSDDTKNIFVFVNNDSLEFALNSIPFVLSNTLTF